MLKGMSVVKSNLTSPELCEWLVRLTDDGGGCHGYGVMHVLIIYFHSSYYK